MDEVLLMIQFGLLVYILSLALAVWLSNPWMRKSIQWRFNMTTKGFLFLVRAGNYVGRYEFDITEPTAIVGQKVIAVNRRYIYSIMGIPCIFASDKDEKNVPIERVGIDPFLMSSDDFSALIHRVRSVAKAEEQFKHRNEANQTKLMLLLLVIAIILILVVGILVYLQGGSTAGIVPALSSLQNDVASIKNVTSIFVRPV